MDPHTDANDPDVVEEGRDDVTFSQFSDSCLLRARHCLRALTSLIISRVFAVKGFLMLLQLMHNMTQ